MRIKTAAMALLALLMVGCGGDGDTADPTPTSVPSIDPAAMINIDGNLIIYQNGENYRIECKSNIPNGAFVTMFIEDENESVLSEISDLKQRNTDETEDIKKSEGRIVAEVPVANLAKFIELNGSTKLFVRMQFFPGNSSQPDLVKEICGDNGELLTGNNVQKDDLSKQTYIEMLSEGISLNSVIAPANTDDADKTTPTGGDDSNDNDESDSSGNDGDSE